MAGNVNLKAGQTGTNRDKCPAVHGSNLRDKPGHFGTNVPPSGTGTKRDKAGHPLKGVVSRLSRSECPDLVSLADRVRRLVPSHRDPERFHVEKSEIEHALRQMAREIE
jgi:hypothetical protein